MTNLIVTMTYYSFYGEFKKQVQEMDAKTAAIIWKLYKGQKYVISLEISTKSGQILEKYQRENG